MVIKGNKRPSDRAVRFNGLGRPEVKPIITAEQLPKFFKTAKLYNEIILQPGESFGHHRHYGNFEVIFVTCGQLAYTDDDQNFILEPGDVCVCNDGHEHEIRNESQNEARYLALVMFS